MGRSEKLGDDLKEGREAWRKTEKSEKLEMSWTQWLTPVPLEG